VAVFTIVGFDAGTVDPDTVEFAGAEPVRCKLKDVDDDGDMDMLFHFKTQELELTKDSTEATLTGTTFFGGKNIELTDEVRIVPVRKGKFPHVKRRGNSRNKLRLPAASDDSIYELTPVVLRRKKK
jgi:hypothetical protein